MINAISTIPRKRSVIVVLPAYNEEAAIAPLVGDLEMELGGLAHRIVVVNDGSTDRTQAILVRLQAAVPSLQVIRHERNGGLGSTIRDGLHAALCMAGDDDVIVTMDADRTHLPALAQRMVALVREGCDVVIASRYREGARIVGLSALRRFLSRAASLLFRFAFPIPGVRDYTCGYRAYRAAVLKDAMARYGPALLQQEGFSCMVDILLKLRRLPVVFGEVPIVLRYDRKRGASKMPVWKTVRATLGLLVRAAMQRSV